MSDNGKVAGYLNENDVYSMILQLVACNVFEIQGRGFSAN